MHLEVSYKAYLVGIGCALLLPCLAFIAPINDTLQVQLRDALDLFRQKVSNISVQFTRLEETYGLNIQEFLLGLQLTVIGVASYVIVPMGTVGKGHLA